MRFDIDTSPNPTGRQVVVDGLNAYNRLHVPPDGWEPLSIFVRDDADTILGGLVGETFWNWLHIELLWIDETQRRHGLGTRLLAVAEEQAIERGCLGAFVNTMDFQAPDFYHKHGYCEEGRIPDLPRGHWRIHLQKRFADADATMA
jgi:GNAT superfamily N-acetyltransferase